MAHTKIEWATDSWNVVSGCSKISEGCLNCYAERMAHRLRGRFGYPEDDPFRVTFHPDRLEEPLSWRKPRRVFVASMGDLFHEDVDDEWLDLVFAVMGMARQHTFLLLTKRPTRMRDYLRQVTEGTRKLAGSACYGLVRGALGGLAVLDWMAEGMPNVWCGVTAENQERAEERVPVLLDVPAKIRFVSCEPLLGPVDLSPWTVDWVIVGAESGSGARPMEADWVRSLRDQCKQARASFYFKQSVVNGKKISLPELDGRQWAEVPDVLRAD